MSETDNSLQGDILAIDFGAKRIGVARVHTFSKLPEPLPPIEVAETEQQMAVLQAVRAHEACALVCGLPRGLSGQETEQTQVVREFALQLKPQLDIPLYLIDEAGTSKEADERMKHMKAVSRDSVAAAIIAEDFVNNPDQESLRVA